jgi:Protein of unknown function (DUF2510)
VTVVSEQARLLVEFPSPQAEEAGWYPDPLRISAERYWDGGWRTETRAARLGLPSALDEDIFQERRRGFRFPSFRDGQALVPPLSKAAREERAQERERERELISIEAARQAFFHTPAGRARLAYARGHRLFQYELEVNGLEPTVIPGPIGFSARETTDPVDILNSVIVEGWKLVTGKFIHVEVRNGVVGCYLFKRSRKRYQPMNDPWQS